MAFVIADRVKETTTTTGTANFVLSGAVSGFQSFATAIGVGNNTTYAAVGGTEWEIGYGTYSEPGGIPTLVRDGVLASSNGGAAVSFSAGTKEIFVTYPAGKAVLSDNVQILNNKRLQTPYILNGYTEQVYAITDGATVNLNPDNGSIQTWTLGASRTPGQTNWDAGQSITLMIDDGTAYSITWTTLGVVWKTDAGSAPTLSTTGYTVITLWKVGTTIYGARVGNA